MLKEGRQSTRISHNCPQLLLQNTEDVYVGKPPLVSSTAGSKTKQNEKLNH